jgi:glycerol-3-phosphate acyltransferase PlsY
MDYSIAILTAIVSYLVGCISFSRIVTRLLAPDADLETVKMPAADGEDGHQLRNIGATTASLVVGPKAGCTIGLLDILKGVVPVLLLRIIYPDQYYFLIAAIFVVVGHNWPIFYGFRGGGGISPTYGGFFVIDFLGTIVSAFAGMIFGFFIIKDILIAYTSGLWFMLVWLIIFKGEWPYIIYGIIMNIIFTLGILPELRDHIKKKRAGEVDMRAGMESFPMGRGMLKIMNFFGIEPRKRGDG